MLYVTDEYMVACIYKSQFKWEFQQKKLFHLNEKL